MAEKATKKSRAPEPTSEDKAQTKAARAPKTTNNDQFYFVGRPEGEKLAPQANAIVNILEAAGNDGLKRVQLISEMTTVIETKQPIERILTYYQKSLVERGFIRIESTRAKSSAEEPAEAVAE